MRAAGPCASSAQPNSAQGCGSGVHPKLRTWQAPPCWQWSPCMQACREESYSASHPSFASSSAPQCSSPDGSVVDFSHQVALATMHHLTPPSGSPASPKLHTTAPLQISKSIPRASVCVPVTGLYFWLSSSMSISK
jgi:hypothetical protein